MTTRKTTTLTPAQKRKCREMRRKCKLDKKPLSGEPILDTRYYDEYPLRIRL